MSKPVYLDLESASLKSHWGKVVPNAELLSDKRVPGSPGIVVLEVKAGNDLEPSDRDTIQALTRQGHRVLVTTLYPLPAQGVAVIRAGGHGYIHGLAHPDRIRSALDALQSGQVWLNEEVLSSLVAALAPAEPKIKWPENLTRRERDIAQAILEGKSNAEIAETLFIAESTVKTHIKHLFEKMGVHDRLGLVLKLRGEAPIS
ncbi:regulatory protein, luxR family [Sulfurivirga caldicuralii]|uniref:Regulatory protein, luxR family n=1 Tax=Sulfurivirga caldicuralii TaxID=364032 RepID=A0A1N6GET7_9GAMM|nr:response regulator transcription factor [Sulfurivirga caldicuralii]SIO06050.1 regulatory protein, luxR family [Sulfurivirga caldicuralii]